jgi:7-carboxy-7-deazaguanine synthase
VSRSFSLNDLFWTVQGEGVHAGRRALFVRFPYCNYDCPWCDTDYNHHHPVSESQLREVIEQEPARLAILTGGEPLNHKDLMPVIRVLKEYGFYIACETNGSAPAPQEIDFVTTSPKPYTKSHFAPYYVHPDTYTRTQQWKYIVDDQFDFAILDRHQNDPDHVTFALSPEYNNMQSHTERILSYIQKNPRWRLSLQTHKWINVP